MEAVTILAQVAAEGSAMPDPSSIASWLQLGFAVAVAWYLLTKQMPRIEERAERRDAAFLAALDKQHAEHKSEVDDAREWASGELRLMREAIDRGGSAPNGRDRMSNGGGR